MQLDILCGSINSNSNSNSLCASLLRIVTSIPTAARMQHYIADDRCRSVLIYIQYTQQKFYGDASKYFCGSKALRASCYVLFTVVKYGMLASLVLLGVYAKLQHLTDAISSDLIVDWSWEETLFFLAFVNNIRSLNDSEENVVKLLEVLPHSTCISPFT